MTTNTSTMLEPPEESHWISYNTFEGPPDPLLGNECMLSVVLDGNAHASFTGVRLVVVYRESAALRDVTLQECHENRRLGFTEERPQLLEPTHGGRLLMTRRQRQRGATIVSQHKSLVTKRPIHTVVFELVRLQSANCCTLRPCLDADDDTLRVAYSRVWPSSPHQRSFIVFLECSHNFVEPENIMCRCCADIKLPGHSVRIVPTTRARPAFRGTLPPHIVRSIVNHAVNRWARGWRQALLSYALVQKSWLHVLDLYFEGFGTENVGNIGNPTTIVRSLEKKPERGQLITAFCDADFTRWNYEFLGSSTLPKEYEDALSAILKLATEIQHIEVAKARFHNLENALTPLKRVECFTLAYSSPSDLEKVTIKDVQDLAKNWTDLKKLVMYEWSPGSEPPTSALPCRLEELELVEGRLSQAELLSFIEPCRFSLKILKIEQVVDLINADLLTLLLSVSDTLTELVISRCTITSGSPDEEDAFETALPSLRHLVSAKVQGDKITCSSLVIGRTSSSSSSTSSAAAQPPPLSKPLPSPTPYTSLSTSSIHPTSSAPASPTSRLKCIKIHKANDAFLDGLAGALENCSWDAVDLHFQSPILASRQGKILVAQAEEVAIRKGIKLRMVKFPFWV